MTLTGVWSERYDPAAGQKWRDCTQASCLMVALHGGAHIPMPYTWQERERFEDHEGLPEYSPGHPAGTVQETGLNGYHYCDMASQTLYGVVARPLPFADLETALTVPGLAIAVSGESGGLPSGYQGPHSICVVTRGDGYVDVYDPLALMGAAPTKVDVATIWRWASALRIECRVLAQNELVPPPYQARSAEVFTPCEPIRVLDTRKDIGLVGEFYSRTARTLKVNAPAGTVAIAAVLTVVSPTGGGYVFAGPTPIDNPTSSTQNFIGFQTIAAQPIIPLAADGTCAITYVGQVGSDTADVLLDVTGYFAGTTSTITTG
jgi:hypothetical protein